MSTITLEQHREIANGLNQVTAWLERLRTITPENWTEMHAEIGSAYWHATEAAVVGDNAIGYRVLEGLSNADFDMYDFGE